jgi:integrase
MSLPIMHRTLVLLAAGTGMRMSELLGLRWGDVDFAKKKITLNQTWVYGRIENGKTEASRQPVVLGERTAEFLQEWHRQTPYAKQTDWVFASNKLRGKRPISGCQFTKDYIRPRFVEHGLIDADYAGRAGLHAFRHSLATVLIVEEKVDPKTAQGHPAPHRRRVDHEHLHPRTGPGQAGGAGTVRVALGAVNTGKNRQHR